mgnify:CR=1 FL=1
MKHSLLLLIILCGTMSCGRLTGKKCNITSQQTVKTTVGSEVAAAGPTPDTVYIERRIVDTVYIEHYTKVGKVDSAELFHALDSIRMNYNDSLLNVAIMDLYHEHRGIETSQEFANVLYRLQEWTNDAFTSEILAEYIAMFFMNSEQTSADLRKILGWFSEEERDIMITNLLDCTLWTLYVEGMHRSYNDEKDIPTDSVLKYMPFFTESECNKYLEKMK